MTLRALSPSLDRERWEDHVSLLVNFVTLALNLKAYIGNVYWMDGWTDGQTDGRMNGWREG